MAAYNCVHLALLCDPWQADMFAVAMLVPCQSSHSGAHCFIHKGNQKYRFVLHRALDLVAELDLGQVA